jgi:hypothetical protein
MEWLENKRVILHFNKRKRNDHQPYARETMDRSALISEGKLSLLI